MTVEQRILAIRIMNEMEQLHSMNSSRVEKDVDGTMKYKDENDNVLIEVKMKRLKH